jgi:hypothetical protein
VRQLLAEELTRVRTQAANWRTGLAGLLALITTVTFVKGRSSIEGIPFGLRVTVGLLVLVAVACACAGTVYSLRAAYGRPGRHLLTGEPGEFVRHDRKLARLAYRDLRVAVVCTFLTLGLVAAAIGITWYAPDAHG